jgi:PRTRC genetic system protein C
MALQTAELKRVFKYNSLSLQDPGPQYTPIQVRDLYSATYPEINTAAIEGPEEKSGELVYTFRRAVGTKGSKALIRTLAGGKKVKRCAGCKQDKELSAFARGTGPGGLHRHCRECCKAYRNVKA